MYFDHILSTFYFLQDHFPLPNQLQAFFFSLKTNKKKKKKETTNQTNSLKYVLYWLTIPERETCPVDW